MADSTNVILPAAQAFLAGELEMPESISPGIGTVPTAWADHPFNSAAVILFTFLALFTLKSFLNILPLLFDSFTRWKGCMTIDSSVRLKSDRNLVGYISILPIALIADRFHLFSAGILDTVPEDWHLAATLGTVIAWLLLRHFFYIICSARARRPETFRTAHSSVFNFIILMAAVMVPLAGIFSFTGISEETERMVLIYAAGFFYLVAILRESQILASFCSQIQTFLYLCALEFIPTGALVAGNILL